MVKWRRHILQSLLRLLSNTAYMSAGISYLHISADLSRAWEFPGGGRYAAGAYHGLTQHLTSNTHTTHKLTVSWSQTPSQSQCCDEVVVTRLLTAHCSLVPVLQHLPDNFPPSSLVVFRGCLSGDLNLPIYFKM